MDDREGERATDASDATMTPEFFTMESRTTEMDSAARAMDTEGRVMGSDRGATSKIGAAMHAAAQATDTIASEND